MRLRLRVAYKVPARDNKLAGTHAIVGWLAGWKGALRDLSTLLLLLLLL